jgi:hypothetical protein
MTPGDDPTESVLDVLDAVAAHWDEANYELVDEPAARRR